MNNSDLLPVREKVSKSRLISKRIKNASFIDALNNVLNNPKNQEIITWSEDGQVIIIDNQERLHEILPQLKYCNSLSQFYRRLDDCRFVLIFESENRTNLKFRHPIYNREKISLTCNEVFIRKTNQKNRLGQEQAEDLNRAQKRIALENDFVVLSRFQQQVNNHIDLNTEILKTQLTLLEIDIKNMKSIGEILETFIPDQNPQSDKMELLSLKN